MESIGGIGPSTPEAALPARPPSSPTARTETGWPVRDVEPPAPREETDRHAKIERALASSRDYLLSIQEPDGHWCAELEGDTILESEYILLMHFLGRTSEARVQKAAEYIRRQQIENSGWPVFPEGPPEISASVKSYFVLKLVGDDPDAPHMAAARKTILELGGIEACNSFTKIYLAIFGQYDWKRCPAVPPSMMLMPRWFFLSIYKMSSWSRAIVVPLSIIWAKKPSCPVPEHAHIPELYAANVSEPADVTKYTGKRNHWTYFFKAVDQALKLFDPVPVKPLRKHALERAEQWILDRLQMSDGLGAIFPPIVNTIIAFRCLGYPMNHPILAGQVREIEKLEIEDEETLRIQPCFSPVWDTSLVLNALLDAGVEKDDPAVQRAARWLLEKEVRRSGDWQIQVPDVEPSGWYFEYANEPYPDCDDTSEVLMALAKMRFPDPAEDEKRTKAMKRARTWLLAMQNKDGGWGAFDKDCDKDYLQHVPFADHNAMLDPSCEDITARTLESLEAQGVDREHAAVRRAIDYLHAYQDEDGVWYGRWGCNYIYGTWLALWGLRSVGEAMDDPRYARAAEWIRTRQNADGGWGELPLSYDDPATKGLGPSTASQTAWALMALFAVGDYSSEQVERGIDYLLSTQGVDGSWIDDAWTGTGFPRVFYLRYHLYATHFPLLALADYCKARTGRGL